MARDIVVGIVGDNSKFNKATTEAVDKAESLGSSLKNVGKGLAIGAGIGAFNLLTGAIETGISKLGEAAEMYRQDQKEQVLLAQALKNNIPNFDGNTKAAEDFAAAQGRLGFADGEVRESLGQLVGITHNLTDAQKLSSLAMDYARAKGVDLATATDIVTKAAQGNGKALKAQGIDTMGATTAAGMLDAIQKNVAGSAEAWAGTNEGKLAASNIKVQEGMEKIGGIVDRVASAVIPLAADAFGWLADTLSTVWEAIQPVVSTILDALGPAFQFIGEVAHNVFGGIISVVQTVAPAFGAVFGAIGTILGAAADVIRGTFDAIRGAVQGVVGFVRGLINSVIGGLNNVIGLINSIGIHGDFPIIGRVDFGFSLGKIPYMHTGGVVPGTPGSDQLTMLQAGERVLPRGSSAPTVIVQIDSFIGSDRDIDRFTEKVADRLRLRMA